MSTITIGMLGAGRIGKVHAAAIADTAGAELVAVADAIPAAAESLAAESGAAVRSVEEIMDDPSIDAVLIASPTDLHCDQIEMAARAGKAVFCEKPIDLDVGRARACLDVVAETGTMLMLGFNRRFDPNFIDVRARIEAGAIGDVEMVNIISRDPGPPPFEYLGRSGGLFKDMTIHDFDMARFLLGEEPVSVSAVGSALVDPEVATVPDVDSAAVTLVTASGRIAQISNSRRATYGYDQRIEVHGSAGVVRAANLHESTVEVGGAHGFTTPPLLDFFLERYATAYRSEMAAFVDALGSGEAPSPDGDDGVRALVLAEAAGRSHRERRTVDVDEI